MGKREKMPINRHGWQAFTLCVSTSMVLILLGLVVLCGLTARDLSRYVRENLTVTVIIVEGASVNDGHLLCRRLWHRPYAKHVDYIGKDEALIEETKAMGADPSEFLDGVNPFPATLELRLKAEYANADSLEWITKELENTANVSEVTYMEDLMNQVSVTLKKVSLVLVSLAVVLLIICFALINNSVRLGIYARRFSIHTMKLVGASWGVIRKPFIIQALALGLIAALLASIMIGIGVWLMYRTDHGVLSVITWRSLTLTTVAIFIFGIAITTMCSYFSVNKFLRMKAGELYKI